MVIRTLTCCAVDEIGVRYLYDPDPEVTLTKVCSNLWENSTPTEDYVENPKLKPKAFYIFTGVVGYRKGVTSPNYPGPYRVSDAPNLMKYIRKNKLGKVQTSAIKYNRTGGPNHKVQIFIWTPIEKRLRQWCKDNRDRLFPDRTKFVPPTTGVYL
jgi:hypothetical protein